MTELQSRKQEKREQKIKDGINRLLEAYTSDELPETIAEAMLIKRLPEDLRPASGWSLRNQVIMLAHGTKDARGFQQWKAVNRFPKKNTAFYIWGPCTQWITVPDEDTGKEVKKSIPTGKYFPIPVHALEDTEGEPVEQPEYSPLELPPLYGVAEHLGVRVDYAPYTGDLVSGFYLPGQSIKHIRLYTDSERTWFHELGHAADDKAGGMAQSRKGRKEADNEVVAETVAGVLCVLYGYERYLGPSRKYVERHADYDEEAFEASGRVLGRVSKALDLILSLAE